MEEQLTKNQIRARKAWDTRRAKDNKSKKEIKDSIGKSLIKSYNAANKNKFRDIVIKSFRGNGDINTPNEDYILALESSELLFVDALKEFPFIIFELDKQTYARIKNANRDNIINVYNTDVVNAASLFKKFKYAFLDFCDTFDSNEEKLKILHDKLIFCDQLAFTFCLRRGKKELQDYKFDLIKRISKIFPNFYLEYGEAYKDGAPMVGLIFKRTKTGVKDKKYINIPISNEDYAVLKKEWHNKFSIVTMPTMCGILLSVSIKTGAYKDTMNAISISTKQNNFRYGYPRWDDLNSYTTKLIKDKTATRKRIR